MFNSIVLNASELNKVLGSLVELFCSTHELRCGVGELVDETLKLLVVCLSSLELRVEELLSLNLGLNWLVVSN